MTKNNLPVILTEKCSQCVIPANALGTNEIVVREILMVPEEKPDVEQINQIIIKPEVKDVKIVGIKDTRCDQLSLKVIIEGVLHEKIIYTACKPDQPVHSAEFTIPVYGYVILDFELDLKKKCGKINLLPNLKNLIDINLCVEDVSVKMLSGRKLIKNVTLLATVTGDVDDIIEIL